MRNRQLIFPAYENDLPPIYARLTIRRKDSVCIHCGKTYEMKKNQKIMYTEVNGKIIWWHITPPCMPDPIEETQ